MITPSDAPMDISRSGNVSPGESRFSSTVCFAVPVRRDRAQEFYDIYPLPGTVDTAWIDEDTAEALFEFPTEATPSLLPVQAGRGASGVAVGMAVLEVLATIGGAGALLVQAASLTKEIWRRLRRTERGFISISSGAAALLAADHALSRNGGEELRLINFGPLDAQTDTSYSEFDVYWAILEIVETEFLEFYLVSDKGDVTLVGSVRRPIDPTQRR